jgi:hypothetical protein
MNDPKGGLNIFNKFIVNVEKRLVESIHYAGENDDLKNYNHFSFGGLKKKNKKKKERRNY